MFCPSVGLVPGKVCGTVEIVGYILRERGRGEKQQQQNQSMRFHKASLLGPELQSRAGHRKTARHRPDGECRGQVQVRRDYFDPKRNNIPV
jgi:hypothetical protein